MKNLTLTFSLFLAFFLSQNVLSAQTCSADGGLISTDDPTTICALDGSADPITVSLSGAEGQRQLWLITDDAGNILAITFNNVFDLEGAGAGVCLIWHLSYNSITGLLVGNNANDLSGCYDLSNPIAVTRLTGDDCPTDCGVFGGTISTNDPTTICAGDGNPDPIYVDVEGAFGPNSAWVITDDAGTILALPPAPPFDLEGAGGGVCLIWYVRYDELSGAMVGNNAMTDLEGCFDLSNPIAVTRNGVNGGTISTNDPTYICAGDGNPDPIHVTVSGAEGTNSAWVITDDAGTILALPPAPPFDLEGAGEGVCLIWYLRYEDGLMGIAPGNNALTDLSGCYDLSNPIAVTRTGVDGGTISTNDPTTICAGDGQPDPIYVDVMGASGANSAWVITDEAGTILALPPAPPFDLEGAGGGVCLIWYVRYDELYGAQVGNNALTDLEGCFDLSNSIAVTRITGRACRQIGGFQPLVSNGNELLNQLDVFPNPAREVLNLNYEVQSEQAVLGLFDLTGRQVLNRALDSNESYMELNIGELESGIYMLRIKDGDQIITKRVVKQ
jgi:hypothetical protein